MTDPVKLTKAAADALGASVVSTVLGYYCNTCEEPDLEHNSDCPAHPDNLAALEALGEEVARLLAQVSEPCPNCTRNQNVLNAIDRATRGMGP